MMIKMRSKPGALPASLSRYFSTTPQMGVTLIELVVTISILAILMMIAVPSFTNATLSSKLTAFANEIVGSVYLARSEAMKRNAAVTLCMSSDGASCATSGSWEQGWIVLAPDGTTVLQRQAALSQGFVATSGVSSISFQPTGVGATAATLKVCRSTPTPGAQERIVTISLTGQPMVTTTTTGICP